MPQHARFGEQFEMTEKSTYFTKTIFFGTCLVLGCFGGGTLGCGSSDSVPTVDSELLGVYQIDVYQFSPDSCDGLTDVDPRPGFLVLYSFLPNDDPEEARLGATFCSGLSDCRAVAEAAPEPVIGYSFTVGDDHSGWTGLGNANSGLLNDQCKVDVQVHTLTSTAASIDIQTKTLETVYSPRPEDVDGSDITCRVADAIASLNDDLPCVGAYSLAATFEASL
jgi:hypothetical protein